MSMMMTIVYECDEYDDDEADILAKVRQMMVPACGMGGWEKRLWMNAIYRHRHRRRHRHHLHHTHHHNHHFTIIIFMIKDIPALP